MLGVPAEWVDDIAQETFLTAYRQFDRFDSKREFIKWVRGIARNIVLNERRKEARHARIINDHLTELLDEPELLSQTMETSEMIISMNRCMEQLPEKSRQLLRDRYENNENASVLGARFSMSPESIRQSLMKIRIILMRCIKSHKIGRAHV